MDELFSARPVESLLSSIENTELFDLDRSQKVPLAESAIQCELGDRRTSYDLCTYIIRSTHGMNVEAAALEFSVNKPSLFTSHHDHS